MALGIGRSSATFTLCSALAMLAGGAVGVARADGPTPGGNCCADLEERVAELEATTARKGNRRVSLTVSGQVATHLLYWNDGGSSTSRSSDVYIVDNTNALGGTQFQFAGSAKINPNLSAGFQIVIGLDAGARSAGFNNATTNKGVTQTDDDGGAAGDTAIVLTLANWYLDHKSLGRVTVGRANTATAGVSTIDLGGTGVIANANLGYWHGNFGLISNNTLRTATWGDALGIGALRNSGLSRANVISYTSPTFGGFSFGASWGENDLWDVALRYAGEFSGFRVAAGIGYISNTTGFGDRTPDLVGDESPATQAKGSISILHVPTGLFATGAYVHHYNDLPANVGDFQGTGDSRLFYLQGGITKNWTGLGNTAFYGEYAKTYDGVFSNLISPGGGTQNTADSSADFGVAAPITGSETTMWGLGVVQNIDAAALELFLSYRHYEAEVNTTQGTTNFNDVDLVVGGGRIRF